MKSDGTLKTASNDLNGGLIDKPSQKPNAHSNTITSLQPNKQTNNVGVR